VPSDWKKPTSYLCLRKGIILRLTFASCHWTAWRLNWTQFSWCKCLPALFLFSALQCFICLLLLPFCNTVSALCTVSNAVLWCKGFRIHKMIILLLVTVTAASGTSVPLLKPMSQEMIDYINSEAHTTWKVSLWAVPNCRLPEKLRGGLGLGLFSFKKSKRRALGNFWWSICK